MKYFICGDFHGKDLQRLEKALLIENPDSIICLSDFDQIKTIHEFMEIEKEYLKKGKQVIKVPGNHDYAILKNQSITSSQLSAKGKTSYQIHQELLNDKEAHDYLSKLVDSPFIIRDFLDKSRLNEKFPFVVMHGAYSGNLGGYPGCPEELTPLWNKIISEKDFSPNFKEMGERGEKVMIKGHEHFPIYSLRNNKGEENTTPTAEGDKYELSEENQHIINPGAFLYGHYATIDTSNKTPILEYKNA